MSERVFLAGATGAIGAALVPLLVNAGYEVHGTTRRSERAAVLRTLGAQPVVVDVFDAHALSAAVQRIAPAAVIHQLTDLPPGLDPRHMGEAILRNRCGGRGERDAGDINRSARTIAGLGNNGAHIRFRWVSTGMLSRTRIVTL